LYIESQFENSSLKSIWNMFSFDTRKKKATAKRGGGGTEVAVKKNNEAHSFGLFSREKRRRNGFAIEIRSSKT
jgi:hypothetical protein